MRQEETGRMGHRKDRDISPSHDKFQRNGAKYQTNTPASPQNYRDTSKNSRGNTDKSVRGLPLSTTAERRERTQAVGLSSKLDQLRF